MDSSKKLERIIKGAANHWRIKILFLLEERAPLSVFAVSGALHGNFKTIAEHLRRLHHSGLVTKRYRGKVVLHELTSVGKLILKFLRMLE